MPLTVYGIPNCDTVKKARRWLEEQQISYAFHDYNKAGLEPDRLADWIADVGWEILLNRAGTTFRALSDTAKADLDAKRAMQLMLAQPSMIKRPVVEGAARLLVGFKPDNWVAAGIGAN